MKLRPGYAPTGCGCALVASSIVWTLRREGPTHESPVLFYTNNVHFRGSQEIPDELAGVKGGGGRVIGERAGPGLTARTLDCRPRLNIAGHERSLHLGDCVIDRHAGTFVQDFHAEDLSSSKRRPCSLDAGQDDVEGQDLIGVPGGRQRFEARYLGQRDIVQVVDRSPATVRLLTEQHPCGRLLKIAV